MCLARRALAAHADALLQADPKNSGIAKDDKAKDAAKEAEEAAALKALMDEYGGEALRDAYWKFVKLSAEPRGMSERER